METNALLELLHESRFTMEQIRARDPQLAERISQLVGTIDTKQVLGAQPQLASLLSKARLFEVIDIAGLSGSAADRVAKVAAAPSDLAEALLTKLVADGSVTDEQAQVLGLSAALFELVADDTALAKAIRTTTFGPLGGAAPKSTRDLAQLGVADWHGFLTATTATLPEGTTPESLSAALAARLAVMHPTAAMAARLPRVDPGLTKVLIKLGLLFERNAKVIGARFEDLDTTGINQEELAQLRRFHAGVRAFALAYAPFEIAALLDDKTQTPEVRASAVTHRVGLVQSASRILGEAQILWLDLTAESPDLTRLGLDKLHLTPEEKGMALAAFRGYQRAWRLAGNVDDAIALARAGFTSAVSIGALPRSRFHELSGLDEARAARVWDSARVAMADVSLTAGAVLDVMHGLFDELGVGNQPSSAAQYLKKLPGFEEMFGSIAFCDCEECQSILGPAAYFVDLMKYIDDNLRGVFATRPDHPLDLKTRRPDLWTVPLTCDATTRRVPTLDLVDEILENYVARRLGYTGSLDDRATIGTLVYEQTLGKTVDSFRQPFELPQARVSSYLAAMGRTRAEVAAAVAAKVGSRVEAELGLSARTLGLVTTRDLDLDHLRRLYGLPFWSKQTGLVDIDAATLAAAMGLTRAELGQVVATWFVAASGAHIAIHGAKRDDKSVQNDVEWVSGLTADALDRMHRLTRLARASGWSIPEVDLLLATKGDIALAGSAAIALADMHQAQVRLGVAVPELCALVGAMPHTPPGTSLFDRVFNPPSFVAADGALPQPARRFVHPAFRQSSASPIDPALTRLTTALSVDQGGLAALARHLAPHLARENAPGFDPDAPNDADRYFVLSAPNLTLLYRHARLARLLGVTIDDLFQLLGFLGLDRVTGILDLLALIDLHDRWRAGSYRLDDVAVATGQLPRDASRYPDPAAIAAQVVAAAASALTFRDTLFAAGQGTTEQGSRDLLASNPSVVEAAANGAWRLVAGIDLDSAPIMVPPTAVVATPPAGTRLITAGEVRADLEPYRAFEVLVRSLGAAFAITTDKVIALAALANASLTSDATAKAVRGDGPIGPLVALIATLRPLVVALAGASWDAAAIDFVRTHAAAFGDGTLPRTTPDVLHPNTPFVTLEQLRALGAYARLAARQMPPSSAADVRDVLASFDPATHRFSPASDPIVARVLGVPVGLVVGLHGRVTLPAVASLALDQLDRATQLATTMGVDGETLGSLVSDDYPTLSHAADGLFAAIGAAVADETTRAAKLDAAEQPVREARRDALAEYLTRSITPKLWSSLDELYEYFLIDVEAGGCSTTSRVVAAISSAQLYVHRALMNLESDDLPPSDPNHISVRFRPDDGAATEWVWRKNFRVWQANREVFLWPENYLEPDLRDDKTPLFKELEQELLQTDIDDQNVLDAYTKYLAGLEEVASLSLAGAYHDVRADRDVLHLFGVTAADPPTYYYRTCENLINRAPRDHRTTTPIWSAWQKVTVQIAGRKVSPFVHNGRLHLFWTEIKSRSMNRLDTALGNVFYGHVHTMSLRFTSLRADGTWTPPQDVLLLPGSGRFGAGHGQIEDELLPGEPIAALDLQRRRQVDMQDKPAPIDDYTLSGPNWDWVWPSSSPSGLGMMGRNVLLITNIDLFKRTTLPRAWANPAPPWPRLLFAQNSTSSRPLYSGTPNAVSWQQTAFANFLIEESRIDQAELEVGWKKWIGLDRFTDQLGWLYVGSEILAVPGSEEDALIQLGSDLMLLQGSTTTDSTYVGRRFGTTLVEGIARHLFEGGLDTLLSTETQMGLKEAGLPIIAIGDRIRDHSDAGTVDFNGAYGTYYRELFFHIPYLIANALNSRGRFAAAQRWYHFIFDPTATEDIDTTGVPPDEVAHRLLDRVWRYREFRGLDVTRLRDILTDGAAIALYKQDPFNPWAIARRRISAVQKAIVMRYVDNLVDWADSLFTQFTMESVNEALMLYVMASDVLGARPNELGDCGAGVTPMTYEKIGPLVDGSSEILVELETLIHGARVADAPPGAIVSGAPKYAVDHAAVVHAVAAYPLIEAAAAAATSSIETVPFRGLGWNATRTASWGPALGGASVKTADKVGGRTFEHAAGDGFSTKAAGFAWSIIRQLTPVFCVPVNRDLLAYWDRVDDRLYKIRHCMDIDGQRRELALFAPPINPADLIAMKAAGLTLEDVLGATGGNLPPYRFLYLIDRAKAFAASLSGFGATLLSALEKKDAEHLNRVRLTQQMNLTRLTTQVRQLEIQTASESLAAVQSQRDAAQYRRDYYDALFNENRNGWELAQSLTFHTASGIRVGEAVLDTLAASLALLPQVGSPFAMKYGGVELSGSVGRFGNALEATAQGLQAMAGSMALEAEFGRRRDSWKHQRSLADWDIKSLDRQVIAAQIRFDIANRSLALHQKGLDQLQEMIDLTDGRFTNLGLYTWLATQLQRTYRGAYQNALGLAKLAEQAFRFERGDDTLPGLAPSYWDPTHAGLLAGEQLLIDLQTLERRFLETNYRTLEIDQPFALSQIDPQALVTLRETGECRFAVPEVLFDLFYPGDYKRRIKAVRLTIPCITGPYVNVSARLDLEKSWVRSTAALGAPLVNIPPSRSVSIATSTAQNDAGVFELSFRDERYMPFEGLGAISDWHLTVPKSFRQFDYQTINDVILSISYTASTDGVLRERVEAQTAELEGSILHYLSNNYSKRVFSLRQDFSSAFTRLLRSAVGTPIKIELTDRNFPLFVARRSLHVERGAIVLRTASGVAPSGFQLTIDGVALDAFTADPTLGNLPATDLPGAFTANPRAEHTLTLVAAGDLAPTSPPPGDSSALDASKLLDVLVYLKCRLA